MKARLLGTQAECEAAVAALSAGFEVREVSRFYPNRGECVLGRIYVDVEPDPRFQQTRQPSSGVAS